jgi:uncharacterized protein (DUF1810 family)
MTDRKIVESICMGKMNDTETRKFFQSALDNTRKKSLADVFPAACYVASKTNNYDCFSLAQEIMNQVWIRLSPWFSYWRFEHVVYNIYWPRICSIRKIKIRTAEPDDDVFFWDSLNWIRSIRNIKRYNHDLYRYFESLSRLDDAALREVPLELKGRALEMKNKKATPEERLRSTLASSQIQDAVSEFAYVTNNTEEARILLDSIIQKDGLIELDDGVICINKLLRRNRNKRVRRYVLTRIQNEKFFFAERDLADFYTSAAIGIMTDYELRILKELAPGLKDNYPNISETLKLARDNLAAEKFQTEAIRNSEIVKETIKKYSYQYHPVYDMDRFHKMDEIYYETAVKELRAGQKRSHYMWYLFPQLKGLGKSLNSEYYGVEDLDEAKQYFADPVLREHLLNLSQIILDSDVQNIQKYLPDPDYLKLHSCMTLFRLVSPHHTVFNKVLNKYFNGEPDRATLYLLSKID